MKTFNSPPWATAVEEDQADGSKALVFHVDPATVYPEYLRKLGWDPTNPDQYQVEVARRCFTGDLFDVLMLQGETGLHMRILRDTNWALVNFPMFHPGQRAAELADSGADLAAIVRATFRSHHKRLAPLVDMAEFMEWFARKVASGDPVKTAKHPALRAACQALLEA